MLVPKRTGRGAEILHRSEKNRVVEIGADRIRPNPAQPRRVSARRSLSSISPYLTRILVIFSTIGFY